MGSYAPESLEAVHYFSEAGRLAFADRDFYVGDPDFVRVPVRALLDPAYLRARGALIRPDRSMKVALPGDPEGTLLSLGRDDAIEMPSTSHLAVVDAQGNALSMTTTIENEFGSKIFVRGFLLNNEMTDFSSSFQDPEGRLVANRIEPGKRPRSAMSPMIRRLTSSIRPPTTSRPRSMMATEVQNSFISARMCDEMSTAFPSAETLLRMFFRSIRPWGSTPLAGSSRSRTAGSGMSVLASITTKTFAKNKKRTPAFRVRIA